MRGVRTKRLPSKSAHKQSLNFYQRIIDYVFRPMQKGRLTISLPGGRNLIYGNGEGGVDAGIRIRNNDFFRKCVLFGDVGFGESYVDGDWETDDIEKVVEWMIINVENHPTLTSNKEKQSPVNFLKFLNNSISFLRKNSLKGSRKNIHDHYDLGNDFFKLFLDPSMTYSAAYFKRDSMTLEEAQYQKYEELCQKIQLKESDHILEIGSGWGGFAVYAAKNFGCHVTTITVSQEQFIYARKKIEAENLSDKIAIELMDYRNLKEKKFDKIVSIEMLEAVGAEYYETYFRQCHSLLKEGGLLALQVILSPDHRFESFRKNLDWIQKHIFPGSLLPSMAAIHQSVNRTGDLNLFHYEDMTMHYVKTLIAWREAFKRNAEEFRALGFNQTFVRKWNYYWSYCIAAFKTRNISVAQMVFARPNNRHL